MDSLLQGRVFDFHRFSVNDGPGIRSSIFLKGCPLDCLWCHNPESRAPWFEAKIEKTSCVSCQQNINGKQCYTLKVFDRLNEKKAWEQKAIHQELLSAMETCDEKAITAYGQDQNSASIISECVKDKLYFEHSDRGGITISGGEPMMQFSFTLELLKRAKANNLHTCLDTSGYASARQYLEVLPYVDLFLWDYKATGETKHRELTGVSQKKILVNMKTVLEHGGRMWLRCPMIPEVNTSEEHLQAIAELSEHEGIEKVHILPYHNMGEGKALAIGQQRSTFIQPGSSTIQAWKDQFKSLTKIEVKS